MKANTAHFGRDWGIFAFCALFLLASVRRWSLWIDEGQTYTIVSGSWRQMLDAVFNRGDAVSGMPLYFIAEFLWCKVFGFGEYALRSMNLVFAAISLLGASRLVRGLGLPSWGMLFLALNPVLVYYMNEARPYAALYACGMWAFVFLLEYFRDWRRRSLLAFAFCMWIGCALHMMFAFMGVAYAAMVAFRFRDTRLRIRDHVLAWLRTVPFFLPLAFHYLRFVLNAPETNAEAPQPLAGIAQIGYYFAGFGGLGWSRNALRARQFGLTWRMAAETGLALAAWLAVGVLAFRTRASRNRMAIRLLASVLAALACFIAANVILKTRFWERHVIYLLPGLSLVLAMVCSGMAAGPSRAARAAVGLFLALYLLSGMNTIAMDAYQKDDYRGALRLARSFDPAHVFFQGGPETFRYYGLVDAKAADGAERPDGWTGDADISGAMPEQLAALLDRTPGNVVFILSEKKEYDKGGLYGWLVGAGLPARQVNSFAVIPADPAVRATVAGLQPAAPTDR
jgi:hypothetical protein